MSTELMICIQFQPPSLINVRSKSNSKSTIKKHVIWNGFQCACISNCPLWLYWYTRRKRLKMLTHGVEIGHRSKNISQGMLNCPQLIRLVVGFLYLKTFFSLALKSKPSNITLLFQMSYNKTVCVHAVKLRKRHRLWHWWIISQKA